VKNVEGNLKLELLMVFADIAEQRLSFARLVEKNTIALKSCQNARNAKTLILNGNAIYVAIHTRLRKA
jgi:hypothetical protein